MKRSKLIALAVAILYVAVIILALRVFGTADNVRSKMPRWHEAVSVDVPPFSEPTPIPVTGE